AERFRLEIQLAAKLQHPHIVPLLQSGDVGGILYFTMPFIEGQSLRERIAKGGALPIPDGIRILRQVASAISYAHRNGVVHRDIKPDNVMLSDEFALVMDFGVARALSASTTAGDQRLTSSGVALGTPAYMAPEQALADPEIDHRADIYAFGVLAYEVLTGAPPFQGKAAQATLAAHVVQPPDPIDTRRAGIPPTVASLIMRCLEKKPEDRPQTAADLLPVLDAATTASPSDHLVATTAQLAVTPRSGITSATAASATALAPARRRLWWAGLAVALTAVIAVAIAGTQMIGGKKEVGSDFTSVAVLPLVNVGGDRADDYFSDGMTDELANALGKLPGLRVASRTSAYAFKGKAANVEEIGRQLKVQTVMEGTVRRAGDKLRVSAQLTNVSDGLALWSDTYERETRDVFSVQDDIARSIAEALKLRLGKQARTFSSASRGTENLAAFDNYLRGRYFFNARGAENLRLAVAYFDSAIIRDPKFARAHAGIAIAYSLLPEYTDAAPKDVSQLTYRAAEKALSLDSTLAEAYTARGLANVHDWKFSDAGLAYRKALQLDPEYPTAHQWYGELLFHTGRLDSSLVQIRTAVELDPLAPINASAYGYALVVAGKYDEAVAVLKKGIEVAPTLGIHHAMLGAAYLYSGRVGQAVPELETAARLDPELALRKGYVAHAYGRVGQKQRAIAIIDQLESRRAKSGTAVALALAYLGLSDNERALTALEEAVRKHDIALLTGSSLVPDKIWDPVRSSPRFVEILQRMNLLPYARTFRRREARIAGQIRPSAPLSAGRSSP
ncbi:MAG TPA: protein kinase, partial [Gemmatimonadaceae bacterium]|nr:protein kinase [Gemmatimonadaceae bacterium]